MSSSEPLIYCVNPACTTPLNPVGRQLCANCQTPLVYRYLWAVGAKAATVPTQELLEERYYVAKPQIWLDTRPELPPSVVQELPDQIIPYLQLYPQRLHVPEAYGFCQLSEASDLQVLLLENVPIDKSGNLYPSLLELWPGSSAVRQVYWLWQMLQLWTPLTDLGVASSLLSAENLRVQGWRVWLRELLPDADASQPGANEPSTASLQDLGRYWSNWIPQAQMAIAEPLREICQQMQAPDAALLDISTQLNQLLLEQAAQLPLRLQVAGAMDSGSQRSQNEDTCYPTFQDLQNRETPPHQVLIPHLAIVCDGIGGHEGGEVASQLAVRTLQLQLRAYLAEIAEQTELLAPDLLMQQLEATIRVVNNLIATQNDTQGRESRQRMGTTLVMALQAPQQVETPTGFGNAHELYLAWVGDSRAYWITRDYCQLLTVDDDVASREVRLGRSLYREALQRFDAGALTQALGTRDAEFLQPTTQRFVLEEDGLLLLCSDGLSDNDLVERTWGHYAQPVLDGEFSLEAAVQLLINLANEKNGHDNISVVLTHCRVAPEHPVLVQPTPEATLESLETEFSEASKALLDPEEDIPELVEPAIAKQRISKVKALATALGLLTLLLVGGAGGFFAWSRLDPRGFQQMRDRLPATLNERLNRFMGE